VELDPRMDGTKPWMAWIERWQWLKPMDRWVAAMKMSWNDLYTLTYGHGRMEMGWDLSKQNCRGWSLTFRRSNVVCWYK
jgi:hypothetical protein